MKYNYPPLGGICGKCRGCNRLELDNFKGVWRCENYIEEAKEEVERRRFFNRDEKLF